MKKLLLIFCAFFMLLSCNNSTLDLSQVKLNEESKTYNLNEFKVYRKEEQKGHYEVKHSGSNTSLELIDNGEQVYNYIFMEESVSQINFAKLEIDPVLGAKVVDYNRKIGFISVNITPSQTTELIQHLINSLGTPSEVKTNERLEEAVNLGASQILLRVLPQYTKVKKSEFNNEILYPQYLIWDKKDVIYQLVLEPLNNSVSSVVNIISKKALKDKIVMGFHNPEKDLILNKYLK